MKNEETRPRRIRLSREHLKTANDLYFVFGPSRDERYEIKLTTIAKGTVRRHITRLCRAVGIEQTDRPDNDFETALRAAYRSGEHEEAGRHAATIARALKSGVRERDARKSAAHVGEAEDRREHYLVYLHRSAGNIGYARGEVLDAVAADDLKPGEAATLWEGDDAAATGRVLCIDGESITLRDEDGEELTFKLAALAFLGRVVGTATPYTREERARLDALLASLEALGKEDDQILRCTARYKIEKEIYDIEQTALAWLDEDADEWPEVIGAKGGA